MGVPSGSDRWNVIMASCTLLFAAGVTMALGTVGPAVKAMNEALNGPYVASAGWRLLTFGTGAVAGGIVCDSFPGELVWTTALATAMNLGLVGNTVAIAVDNAAPMYIGNMLVGFSSGVSYGLGVILLAKWMKAAADATALGMLCFMSGTIIGSWLFAAILAFANAGVMFVVVGVGLAAASVWASLYLAVPTRGAAAGGTHPQHAADAASASSGGKMRVPLSDDGVPIGAGILQVKELYFLLLLIMCTAAPAGSIANAFSVLVYDLVGITSGPASSLFAAVNFIALFTRLATGYVADMVSFKGFWASGAKNVSAASMVLEIIALLMLRNGLDNTPLFVAGLVLAWIPWATISVTTVLLTKEVFGNANAGLVFGLGNLSCGISTLAATCAMASVAARPAAERAGAFEDFCGFATVASAVTLGCALIMTRAEPCFATETADIEVVRVEDGKQVAEVVLKDTPANRFLTEIGHIVEPFAESYGTLTSQGLAQVVEDAIETAQEALSYVEPSFQNTPLARAIQHFTGDDLSGARQNGEDDEDGDEDDEDDDDDDDEYQPLVSDRTMSRPRYIGT